MMVVVIAYPFLFSSTPGTAAKDCLYGFTIAGKQYGVIFDTVGKTSFSECKNSLTQNGIYLSSVISLSLLWQIMKTSLFGTKKAKSSSTAMLPIEERLIYFLKLKELLKIKKIKTVIDNTYPLSNMADAHKYVEKGHKKGNIIISI